MPDVATYRAHVKEEVLHIEGADAEAFALAQIGVTDVPERLVVAMAGLVELGVVETDVWSRRKVLALGGAAAAGAVAVFALPSVAAAVSPPATTPTTAPTTTTVPPSTGLSGMYIADHNSNELKHWDGSALTTAASVRQPRALTTGGDGNLYFIDTFVQTVRRFDGSTVSDVASGSQGAYDLAFSPAGVLLVADYAANAVSVVNGTAITPIITSRVDMPTGLAFDSHGTLFIACTDAATSNGNVVKSWDGSTLSTVIDGVTVYPVVQPWALAVDSNDDLFFSDMAAQRVYKRSGSDGTLVVSSGLASPYFIAFDASDNLYVSNYGNNTVTLGGSPLVATGLNRPMGVAFV